MEGVYFRAFAWPVAHLQVGLSYYLILGIGSELVAIVLLLMLFRRRGWLDRHDRAPFRNRDHDLGRSRYRMPGRL